MKIDDYGEPIKRPRLQVTAAHVDIGLSFGKTINTFFEKVGLNYSPVLSTTDQAMCVYSISLIDYLGNRKKIVLVSKEIWHQTHLLSL